MNKKKQKTFSETTREDISDIQKWACGLIDGDGHIGIEWADKLHTKWVPVLKVSLHSYDARAIYKLKQALGLGQIGTSGTSISLRVRRRDHWIKTLLPLMKKFPLRSCKYHAAVYVEQALIISMDPLLERQAKLLKISHLCNAIKLSRHQNLPSPVWNGLPELNFEKPYVQGSLALDYHWLAGFIEAEGSFYILKTGQHGFAIGQAYDAHIIRAIHKHFNITASLKLRANYTMLDTKNKTDLYKLSNALQKRLRGMKSFVFVLWLRTLRKNNKAKSLKAMEIIRKCVYAVGSTPKFELI